jgi:phytanoyl-CoA hydroxylase
MLSSSDHETYHRNGYLILANFISADDCHRLRQRIADLIPELTHTMTPFMIFTTTHQDTSKDDYFLESATQIKIFLEPTATDASGQLKVPLEQAINKIGHAQHDRDPVFREFSYQPKILTLARELGLSDPVIMQSMYLFKQPRIGGEVTCHQDGTFLYTEPDTTLGFWYALEDATIQNGCLWAIPGGHVQPLRSRFVRTPEGGTKFEIYDATPWDLRPMVPLEVSAGSLIVLHSRLPHMSYANQSDKSRQAYSLHLIDSRSHYPSDNWLQC